MKALIQTKNGPVEIEVGAAVNQLATLGAQPGAAPGKTALQILLGWPHGSTAGLGGVDWRTGCGVHRGEAYPIGPSYDDFKANVDQCKALMGTGQLCMPQFPTGSWLIPFQARIPVATAGGGPSRIELQMTQAQASRLYAIEICASRRIPADVIPPPVDPCPCEGGCCNGCGSFDSVFVGRWRSRVIDSAYPQAGRDSIVRTVPSGGAPTESPMEFRDAMAPWCRYSSQALLNGQNFLPPWVQNCELERNNDDLVFDIENRDLVFEADIDIVFHLAFGKFDATKYASACGCVAA